MDGIHPSILHFHITSRCPYSCRHCCSDAGPGSGQEELGLDSIRKMIDQAALFGMEEFELSGGEPLVVGRTPILEVVRHASRLGLLTTLNTNGWFLDEVYVSDLKDAGLDIVKSSLYGTWSTTHEDFTRKEGSFDRVIAALEGLKKNGIESWVNYVVTPKNIEETSALWGLLEPHAVDTIQLSSVVPSGRGEAAQDYVFRDSELREVVERLEGVFCNSKGQNVSFTISLYAQPHRVPFGDRYCDYLRDRLVVDPSGQVIPCCVLPNSLRARAGSIVREGLNSILSSRRLMDEPVFYWLAKGHKSMRERLAFEEVSHNLCSMCIKMLTALRNDGSRGSERDSGLRAC